MAYVVGATNGLNAVADSLRLPLDFSPDGQRRPIVKLVEYDDAPNRTKEIYDQIKTFYQSERVPAVFRFLANDPGYLEDRWGSVKVAFEERKLDRLTKEAIALAVSLAARSDYGIDLHLREARRLGLSEAGVLEVIKLVDVFSVLTKVADCLEMEPDILPQRSRS